MTSVRISLGAIKHNIEAVKRHIAPNAGIIAMVKANAYGHGLLGASRAMLEHGAVCLGVAQADEGAYLRRRGIDADILIVGAALPEDVDIAVAYDLMLTVFDVSTIHAAQRACCEQEKTARVHIKIEAGMNRLGVRPGVELDDLLCAIKACDRLEAYGMFCHLAVADEPEQDDFTQGQLDALEQARAQAHAVGLEPKLHASNSAGAMYGLDRGLDFVRAGIALYGLDPAGGECAELMPVLSWHSVVTQVKIIAAGETVGYGRRFTAVHPTRVATIPVGYADGYHRCMSGQAYVLISGQRAPVIGNICMDQCMVDVSRIPDIHVGDEVVLLGRQGQECICAAQMAAWADTIHYEVLTGIGPRVKRVYVP